MNISIEQFNSDLSGLAWQFHVSPSSCENPDYYDSYIRFIAVADMKSGMGFTHAVIDNETKRLAGFITLRASSLFYKDEKGETRGNPALEILELAVDGDYERNGIGKLLLDIAIYIGEQMRSAFVGVKYILACADPCAVGFYEKHGFKPIEELYEIPRDGTNNNCTPMYYRYEEQ